MTNQDKQREELIKEIKEKFYSNNGMPSPRDFYNFVIEDRKRIVEPLAKWRRPENARQFLNSIWVSIEKTFKNAGVEL